MIEGTIKEFGNPYLTAFSEDLGKNFLQSCAICFLKIKAINKYGTAIKYKIPVFKLRTIEFGFDFKELAAACLHIAHWATISTPEKRMKRVTKTKRYVVRFFKV
ncbi:MAG: hypothetical protein H0U95_07905 [Bacteroidetes bacterium]|nr:hypothetical protein [Bacteroidota bacterium]